MGNGIAFVIGNGVISPLQCTQNNTGSFSNHIQQTFSSIIGCSGTDTLIVEFELNFIGFNIIEYASILNGVLRNWNFSRAFVTLDNTYIGKERIGWMCESDKIYITK